MTYLKWVCSCGNTFISNSKRHHHLDACDKCKDFVDFEDYGLRYGGNISKLPTTFKLIEMNFFDELAIGLKEQKLINPIKVGKKIYLGFDEIQMIRELEDEIMENLK